MLFKEHIFDQTPLLWLGSAADETLILFLGRSNFRKKSSCLQEMLCALHQENVAVCWYESWITKARRELEMQSETQMQRLFPQLSATGCGYKLLKYMMKAMLLAGSGQVCRFVWKRLRERNKIADRDLRDFIAAQSCQRIFIIGLSAGGILACRVADLAPVRKIVCFGYPFRHPDQGEQDYRIAPLRTLSKPALFLQGDADPYGTIASAAHYPVSRHITLQAVPGGHDYDAALTPHLPELIVTLRSFFGSPLAAQTNPRQE